MEFTRFVGEFDVGTRSGLGVGANIYQGGTQEKFGNSPQSIGLPAESMFVSSIVAFTLSPPYRIEGTAIRSTRATSRVYSIREAVVPLRFLFRAFMAF